MKTKLVRPVLIESKERTDIWWSGHKMYYNRTPKEPRTPCYQLILISLEDEKIEFNDKWIYICPINGIDYGDNGEAIVTNNIPDKVEWFEKLHDKKNYFKVINTQSQLSPEYIQQFIEEYDKGDVKDLRIEMEVDGWDYKNDIPQGDYYNKFKPKLTNGYVTIVNTMKAEDKLQQEAKEYCKNKWEYAIEENELSFVDGAKSPEALEYWKEKDKLWTNEEVDKLLYKLFSTNEFFELWDENDLKEWFNQHKK